MSDQLSLRRLAARGWPKGLFNDQVWKASTRYPLKKDNEAGGYFVDAIDGSLSVWLKPINKNAVFVPRAAIEKIASDVAQQIGVAVPAVQLYKRPTNLGEVHHETLTCLSLVHFSAFLTWEQILDLKTNVTNQLAQIATRSAMARASGGVVLDTYLA